MIFLDFIFWGWYQILDKTIYSLKISNHSNGAKEHSFFISFLLHGINIWTILRYLFLEYLGKPVHLFAGLSIAVGVFTIGYFLFYRNKRANDLISANLNVFKGAIFIALTIAYTIGTVYLMLKVGNNIRHTLHPDLPR